MRGPAGGPAAGRGRVQRERVPVCRTQLEVIRAIRCSGSHVATQSEVIRAVVLEDSPCLWGARTVAFQYRIVPGLRAAGHRAGRAGRRRRPPRPADREISPLPSRGCSLLAYSAAVGILRRDYSCVGRGAPAWPGTSSGRAQPRCPGGRGRPRRGRPSRRPGRASAEERRSLTAARARSAGCPVARAAARAVGRETAACRSSARGTQAGTGRGARQPEARPRGWVALT